VTSADTAQAAAMTLLARGPQQVIVTLGVQGCLWSKREENANAISHQFVPLSWSRLWMQLLLVIPSVAL